MEKAGPLSTYWSPSRESLLAALEAKREGLSAALAAIRRVARLRSQVSTIFDFLIFGALLWCVESVLSVAVVVLNFVSTERFECRFCRRARS
jgi:hypothetical protein